MWGIVRQIKIGFFLVDVGNDIVRFNLSTRKEKGNGEYAVATAVRKNMEGLSYRKKSINAQHKKVSRSGEGRCKMREAEKDMAFPITRRSRTSYSCNPPDYSIKTAWRCLRGIFAKIVEVEDERRTYETHT